MQRWCRLGALGLWFGIFDVQRIKHVPGGEERCLFVNFQDVMKSGCKVWRVPWQGGGETGGAGDPWGMRGG